MNSPRRLFLGQLSVIAGITVLNKPLNAVASAGKTINSLHQSGNAVTIYHTNDLHGKLDAVHNNMGGINHIKALLAQQEICGLLLDAGDFLGASRNLSHHQRVIYAMNQMGYHAATVGNNELAHGQGYLAELAERMSFSLVNCNYEFESNLDKLVKQYVIVNSGRFKIGITGVGHQLRGIKYTDAIERANYIAAILKQNEKCDLVICLSHLGFKQDKDKPDNLKLAASSENIDLIISGHDRTLLKGAVVRLNKLKQEVIITHSAWDGLMMGKTVIGFENGKQKNSVKAKSFIAGQRSEENFTDTFAKLRLLEKRLVSA